ncbi:hypothetical protein V6N12_071403 [Hibiscus sabdariffa]|uniref:Wings apart-like protein C-terminal domain-containing protein n=1 Tax=Hibiscus sabdariffa TaxID=183260 RepID=A0ABR2FJW9_9ROSI
MPWISSTSSLMEAQEFGEMVEHVDEVDFTLNGLKSGQPVRIRRASLLSLLSISATAPQRRLLRTHGETIVFKVEEILVSCKEMKPRCKDDSGLQRYTNWYLIETILEHHGLRECFSEIHTNPGFVDEQDRLRIFPHHDFTKSSHGCVHPSCPPNMCKGIVIEKIQASLSTEEQKKTIIYLGDGLGDFCPSLKLGGGDYVMPRKGFPVWDLIGENRSLVKANVCDWSNGEELEHVLLSLINRISIDGNNSGANFGHLYSVDFKLETMSLPASTGQEAFPQALHVFH